MMSSKQIIGILILILKLLYQEIFVGEYNKINYRQTLLLVLTEVAGEGGPDWAPQKFLLSQKFRHLMG